MKPFSLLIALLPGLIAWAPLQAQTSAVLPPAEFQKKMVPGAQLIDVRTPGEYAAGKLPASKLIPINSPDFQAQVAKLDKNKPVLVYCAVGGRSRSATSLLLRMGFKQVYDLKGGIQAWQRMGLPVAR